MLKKAKELFALRRNTSEKVLPQNLLYSERKEQSSGSDPRALKLNINLIFNKGEYKSAPDCPKELAKRREDIEAILAGSTANAAKLKQMAWNGVETRRGTVWKMMLGVLSCNIQEHPQERQRVRRDYEQLLEQHDL